MGFGHRIYRAEDPRSRILKRTAKELGAPQVEVAEQLEEVALEGAPGEVSRPRAGDERRVLLGDRPRRRRDPAAARAGDVRVLARGRLVGAHPRAEAHRPAVPAVGEVRRPGSSLALHCLIWRSAAAQAAELAERGEERELAARGRSGRTRSRARPAAPTSASARSPTARSGSSATARSSSCSAAGSRTRARRAAAPRSSRSSCSRGTIRATSTPTARSSTRSRPPTPNATVRRLAILVLKNGSPHRDTIVLLEGIADDDEHDRELREAAKRVAAHADEEEPGALGDCEAQLQTARPGSGLPQPAQFRAASRHSSIFFSIPALIISTPHAGAGGEEESCLGGHLDHFVLRLACGCAWKYNSRRRRSVTWV